MGTIWEALEGNEEWNSQNTLWGVCVCVCRCKILKEYYILKKKMS